MLVELHVRNFLLIDELHVEWSEAFNALTGETGAGKSVLVGALRLILGGRATPSTVRPGAQAAEVEARFDLADSPAARQMLREAGMLDGDEVVIRRVIHAGSSRSKAYINGRLCSIGELSRLAPHLVDIASQHASVALTDASTHVDYLDAYAGLRERRAQVAELVAHATALRGELEEARRELRDKAKHEEFLRFQLLAIEDVAPQVGELEALRQERVRLRSSEELLEATRDVVDLLSEQEQSVQDLLSTALARLNGIVKLDDSLAGPSDLLVSASTAVEEAGRELARYASQMRADPARLGEVEERMFQLEKLLRAHGPTEQDVLDARDSMRRDLVLLEHGEDELERLEGELQLAVQQAWKTARELSEQRRREAARLGNRIGEELAALGMGTAQVVVEVGERQARGDELQVDGVRLTKDGIDRVEFLIAPNKGMAAKPLSKIASGGELSRALLALKRVLASNGPAGTFVFDEVDTGVGGAIAERIGQALRDIARHRQVICITHLAPIAALAHRHFLVSKTQDADVALTTVCPLQGKERTQEVARMLSGAKVTQASLHTASELIAG